METSTAQSIKLAIVSTIGLSKDALHIYVGLAVFLITAIVMRKPLQSIVPWLLVLVLAVIGELADMRDDILSLGYWRWGASVHDILNTLFWPSVLLFLARFSASLVSKVVVMHNNAINSDVQKRRFALLLHAGYGERSAPRN